MRKHNFELGNSQKHNRSSTYGDQFKPMEKGQAFQGPSKEELKQKMLDLRETHLLLGQDPKNMVTTMKAAFQDRGQNEAGAVKLNRAKLQGSHFELGHLNNDLKSMNQISYDYQHYDNKDIKAEQERLMSEL